MKIENLGSCDENSTLFENRCFNHSKKNGIPALFQRPVLSLPPGAWSVLGAVSMLAVVLVAVNMLLEPQIQGKPLKGQLLMWLGLKQLRLKSDKGY